VGSGACVRGAPSCWGRVWKLWGCAKRAARIDAMRDHGCQPTSTRFMRTCATLGIHQVFTSDNNPKGTADTERVMRTLKEECLVQLVTMKYPYVRLPGQAPQP
jgi:hypothetical protein